MLSQLYTYLRLFRRASGRSLPKARYDSSFVCSQEPVLSDLHLENKISVQENLFALQTEFQKSRSAQSSECVTTRPLDQTADFSFLHGIAPNLEDKHLKRFLGFFDDISVLQAVLFPGYWRDIAHRLVLRGQDCLNSIVYVPRSIQRDAQHGTRRTSHFLHREDVHASRVCERSPRRDFVRATRGWLASTFQDLPRAMRAFALLVSRGSSRDNSGYVGLCDTSLSSTAGGFLGVRKRHRISDKFLLVNTSFEFPRLRPLNIALGEVEGQAA